MKKLCALLLLLSGSAFSQSAWPSSIWNNATGLNTVMSNAGLTDLSGLHWNPQTNRLYVLHGDGRVRVLQYDATAQAFTQVANKTISGGPEGITQANLAANEFYTMDENNYEIRKYTHTANFSSVTEAKHWNLLQAPSPMTDTGNTGPEGIVFVPDASLTAANFTSSVTGQPYTSTKGAGGLFFVAHQDGGYVWVFDINPSVNNDFAYVGKYKTHRNESCDLAFDRSTGLLYILHNISANYLEVTDLSLGPATGGEATFATTAEYFISNPSDGNMNIEGFALMPKCGEVTGSAFLCRDVESDEALSIQQDAIRWFHPFTANGECPPLANERFGTTSISVYPNPSNTKVTIDFGDKRKRSLEVYDLLGQQMLHFITTESLETLDISDWTPGVYLLEVTTDSGTAAQRIVKN